MNESDKPTPIEIAALAAKTDTYLKNALLPFWINRCLDPEGGGALTYFDRHGHPTGETAKPFLMQARVLFTMSSAHRAGYGHGRCAEIAAEVARFMLDHYWDDEHGGWFWIADRRGIPTVTEKVGYGQCFAIYAFSEYALATGDPQGREAALRSYSAVAQHMADTRHGGFLELMARDWQPKPGGRYGGDRKSLDVHMHMMEALTALYEMTRHPTHRRRLLEVIDLILTRMLHPGNGLGYMQFAFDWTPLAPILFATDWGRDAQQGDGSRGPLDMTSPGHNVEFVWLLLHAADILGLARRDFAPLVDKISRHCATLGLDPEYGGVYADVPMDRPAAQTEKQFWQQAEVLIGLLDAYALLRDETYWRAFRNVYDFVFTHLVAMDGGGEWYERVDRRGNVIDSALGHAWKNGYHTVRSMVQTVRRLKQIADAPGPAGERVVTGGKS